jgi:uncharacterized GH25 family protein
MDFSKVQRRPVSDSFVFPKSTEQKLAEALAEIEALKKKNKGLEDTVNYYEAEVEYLENEKLNAENAMLKMKQEEIDDEINQRVADEIKRRSGFRPNYMNGWIKPSKE